ncbi:PilZ domain-containing protein [Jeotgalibacillus sp. ET6]|uniref:PilZ domain-containing protein n=1 Tax=Jeotgalibacillus sp. ET6 TaxID=3037260 RepID=UPI0024188AF9|nr:PilZ domain-containing protein [Jeotgalibacillus sp. ET6]MDG5471704.1 PilZ domain-containing protein [Jeotgalibacillus sp. ET6]
MRYNRNEAFRFAFKEPLNARFSIYEVNGKAVETTEGEIQLLDLSPSGSKVYSELNIPFKENNPVKIVMHFQLNEESYQFKGKIVWKKVWSDGFMYGVSFLINEDMQQEIVKQLKVYVKNVKN